MPIKTDHQAPPFINARKSQAQISLSSLKPQHKNLIWKGIQHADPALAALYQDAGFNHLKDSLDARIMMERKDAERYYRIGAGL